MGGRNGRQLFDCPAQASASRRCIFANRHPGQATAPLRYWGSASRIPYAHALSRDDLARVIHIVVVPGLVPGTHWRWRVAMSYYVYILANSKHGTLYIGVHNDNHTRIWQHRHNRKSVVQGKRVSEREAHGGR